MSLSENYQLVRCSIFRVISSRLTGNAYGDGIALPTADGETYHISPRMQINQLFSQKLLIRAFESRHIARLYCFHIGFINCWVSITENVGTKTHDGHISVFNPVQITQPCIP